MISAGPHRTLVLWLHIRMLLRTGIHSFRQPIRYAREEPFGDMYKLAFVSLNWIVHKLELFRLKASDKRGKLVLEENFERWFWTRPGNKWVYVHNDLVYFPLAYVASVALQICASSMAGTEHLLPQQKNRSLYKILFAFFFSVLTFLCV